MWFEILVVLILTAIAVLNLLIFFTLAVTYNLFKTMQDISKNARKT